MQTKAQLFSAWVKVLVEFAVPNHDVLYSNTTQAQAQAEAEAEAEAESEGHSCPHLIGQDSRCLAEIKQMSVIGAERP